MSEKEVYTEGEAHRFFAIDFNGERGYSCIEQTIANTS